MRNYAVRQWLSPVAVLFLVILAAGDNARADFTYYVDGTNGGDENSGLSPDQSWLTITHALGNTSGSGTSPATIRVSSGIYSVLTNGETYPLVMNSYTRLIGEGPGRTVLDAEYDAPHLVMCTGRFPTR